GPVIEADLSFSHQVPNVSTAENAVQECYRCSRPLMQPRGGTYISVGRDLRRSHISISAKAVRKDEQVITASTKDAIAASASPNWSVKRRLEYVRWARDVANGLRGVNQKLELQFDDAVAAAAAVV